MNKTDLVKSINKMYEVMLACQAGIDYAQTNESKRCYQAMYEAANATYQLLTRDLHRAKKEHERWQYYIE